MKKNINGLGKLIKNAQGVMFMRQLLFLFPSLAFLWLVLPTTAVQAGKVNPSEDSQIVRQANPSAAPVTLRCDWESYLGKYDVLWEKIPGGNAFDAPIIGNGASGTYLIYNQESRELRFEMSRNDLCETRRDFKNRKSNGWFRFGIPDSEPAVRCRLDLYRAQIQAGQEGKNAWKLTALAVPERDVILFEIECADGLTNGFNWDFVPDNRQPFTSFHFPRDTPPFPPQTRMQIDGCTVSVQEMPADAAYRTENETAPSQHAVAWRTVADGGRVRIISAVAMSRRSATAARDAVQRVNKAFTDGFDVVREDHRSWWRTFYAKSFVSIPSAFERWHCLQLYRIGSITNPDSITDLIGPWYDINMMWNGIWFNWNTQKMYTSVFTSNHPELADAVLNFIWKHRDKMYDPKSKGYFTRWGAISAIDGTPPLPSGQPYDPACLAWLLTLAYERYQCTMETSMLLEKAVPLMVGAVNFYREHYFFTGDDGKIHIKEARSPEFSLPKKDKFQDTTFHHASIRWLCRTLMTVHQKYGVPAAGVKEYSEILEKLAPYCIDPQQGFMIGKDQPLDHAHRHDSHELAIWPYLEYLPSDPAQAKVILNTMATHKQVGFQKEPGMANATWALFSAMFGRGDEAASMLTSIFSDDWISRYTTTCIQGRSGIRRGYCQAGPFFTSRVIQELLLQSWGDGIIRVFPSVPSAPQWQNIAFHNFRAKGAFLVSAKRTAGVTQFIQVQSLAGEPCSVQTDMTDPLKLISGCGATFADLGKGLVRIDGLGKGHWCLLYSGNELPDLVIAPGRSLE